MSNPIFISVGGGKGGVGKSTITANIGALIANQGHSVGFIDADLGGANLHLCLGVKRPAFGLQDFVCGSKKALSDVAVQTAVPGSWLISGASDFLELSNPKYAQKQKILNNLKKMKADYIFVDLGAGSDFNVTDFYAAFTNSIVVIDGMPLSIENAYGFLKSGIVRGLMRLFPGRREIHNAIRTFTNPGTARGSVTIDELIRLLSKQYPAETDTMREWLKKRKTFLILNMVRSNEDIKIGERFSEIVKKYLSIRLHYIGYVTFSHEVRASIKEMKPIVLNGQTKTGDCFQSITRNLIKLTQG
ncbi:Flagellar synthesis regulator FleN [Chitinispirillum alkaliphilum]|nr:Flagellar synthesis regulator FleN [Chitinispirillum alkaliphilum]